MFYVYIYSAKLFDLIVFEKDIARRIEWRGKKNADSRIRARAELRKTKCLQTNRRRFRRGKSTNAPRSNLMHHPGIKIVPHAWFSDSDPRISNLVVFFRTASRENCVAQKNLHYRVFIKISENFIFLYPKIVPKLLMRISLTKYEITHPFNYRFSRERN